LRDGSRIILTRSNGELTGNYSVEVWRGEHCIVRTAFNLEKEKKFNTPEDERIFIGFLNNLQQSVHFLSADREINSDLLGNREEDEPGPEEIWVSGSDVVFPADTPRSVRQRLLRARRRPGTTVTRAMRLAEDWVREQNLRAAKRGTDSAHNIYTEIVNQISLSPESTIPSTSEKLIGTLRSLADRSTEYARFGFTSRLNVEDMLSALRRAPGNKGGIIENVLVPYINGTNARLDQLKDIHSLTETFIKNINSFYRNKEVTFDLNGGLSITLDNGTRLDPELLSSGEKHLMLLFCHSLISNDSQSIFIIDEPELSLNVKWQRSVLRSLLEIVRSGNVQFILATHSMEILSDHLV